MKSKLQRTEQYLHKCKLKPIWIKYEVSHYMKFKFYLISSIQLAHQCQQLLGSKFIGVFPLDKLPSWIPNGGLIVNSQTSNLEGEHWIAVYIHPNVIKVFDPMGLFYPPLLVSKLEKLKRRIEYNRIMYQSPFTETCGHYCILWLHVQSFS